MYALNSIFYAVLGFLSFICLWITSNFSRNIE